MYRKPPTKRQKKILRSLATTRRILLLLSKEVSAMWHTRSPWWLSYRLPSDNYITEDDRRFWEASRSKRALVQLRQKRFVEVCKQGNRVIYELTDRGRIATCKELIRIADEYNNDTVCIVSFDIPEQERALRDQIRYLLKDFGFKREQQSLWTSTRSVGSLLVALVQSWKAERWIRVYEATPSKPLHLLRRPWEKV